MTWTQFRNSLAVLLAAFPNLKPDEATLKVWFALLKDLSAGSLERAVLAFCQMQREIYPGTNVVACLRELAHPDAAQSAMEAWGEVRAAIRQYGEYQTPQFSHPRIAKMVECLGWRTLCLSENIEIERAHFLKGYDQLAGREREQRLTLPAMAEQLHLLTSSIGK